MPRLRAIHESRPREHQRGNQAEALELVGRAVAAQPRNTDHLTARGLVLSALGGRQEAILSDELRPGSGKGAVMALARCFPSTMEVTMAEDREYERALAAAVGKVRVDIAENLDGKVVATIIWGPWISDGIVRDGSAEGPMDVPEALRRADEIAELYGLTGVVIGTMDERLWQPEWGLLRPDHPHLEEDDESASAGAASDVPTRQWI